MNAAIRTVLGRVRLPRFEGHERLVTRLMIIMAAMSFIATATVIIAFDDIFPSQTLTASLQVGNIAPENIYAPEAITYPSEVLTEQRRETERAAVRTIYELPDPLVAQRQTELARLILDFIENIRRDNFASAEQQTQDLRQITALDLDDVTINQIIEIDNDDWLAIDNQVLSVLESVFQQEIRESDLPRERSLVPNRVGVRLNERQRSIIVAIVSDLIQPNTREDQAATTEAREAAASSAPVEIRSFERGQLVVSGGNRITALDYEALEQLGLLRSSENRFQAVGQALIASIVMMVVSGLFMVRFAPAFIYSDAQMLTLVVSVFLFVLAGARIGLAGEIYVYPTAALGLLLVAVAGIEIAVIATLGLAFLVGIMAGNSLEISTLVTVGGIIGALTLRRSERLNSYFFAGLMVAVGNIAVIMLFNLTAPNIGNPGELFLLVSYALLNGILTAAAALAAMYIVTMVFNLPTALKLAELSQPNQPLLQRLLREAPGTYHHTLQVANLAEQAAIAIGANSELTHVAALYHDIGKMRNPAFFTENQRDIGNPHDVLNDPYRSADIIIGHATGGDEMARQYRLPNRLRDFIREHHGTSEVYVFYKQAVILAGDDESLVDKKDFMYPGPRPQSRETGILMLADSCEAAVRSSQPRDKQEIAQVIENVIDGKRKAGQLDASNLTLNDIKIIRDLFIEMLQAIFHPRINYDQAIAKMRKAQGNANADKAPSTSTTTTDGERGKRSSAEGVAAHTTTSPPSTKNTGTKNTTKSTTNSTAKGTKEEPRPAQANDPSVEVPGLARDDDDEDDTPMAEVPRLRRTADNKHIGTNGTSETEARPNARQTSDVAALDSDQNSDSKSDDSHSATSEVERSDKTKTESVDE